MGPQDEAVCESTGSGKPSCFHDRLLLGLGRASTRSTTSLRRREEQPKHRTQGSVVAYCSGASDGPGNRDQGIDNGTSPLKQIGSRLCSRAMNLSHVPSAVPTGACSWQRATYTTTIRDELRNGQILPVCDESPCYFNKRNQLHHGRRRKVYTMLRNTYGVLYGNHQIKVLWLDGLALISRMHLRMHHQDDH